MNEQTGSPASPLPALTELLRLHAATTQGKWIDDDVEDCTHLVVDDTDFGAHRLVREHDYRLLFSSHNLLPEVARQVGEVVRRLEEAERENERLEIERSRLGGFCDAALDQRDKLIAALKHAGSTDSDIARILAGKAAP